MIARQTSQSLTIEPFFFIGIATFTFDVTFNILKLIF